ncbi:hypothetical protein [Streptomyces sp. NPDC052701]|uniref:hypothetical protein n=1 Tax=Streptomyces sp. NPDC052701 TaxID=3155533 RepID=UPI003444808B
MLQDERMHRMFRPDLENPTREDAEQVFPKFPATPAPYAEPIDVSHAVAHPASDESRFVTGAQLRVDAGQRSSTASELCPCHGWRRPIGGTSRSFDGERLHDPRLKCTFV